MECYNYQDCQKCKQLRTKPRKHTINQINQQKTENHKVLPDRSWLAVFGHPVLKKIRVRQLRDDYSIPNMNGKIQKIDGNQTTNQEVS